jgi:cell division protein FtsQ
MLRILKILLWISLPVLVVVVGFIAQNHYNNRRVDELAVEINYNKNGESNRLLTYEDIHTFVRHRYDSIVGRRVKDIDIERVEKDLSSMKYVKDADVFSTINGKIQIRINQRKAIVRVIDAYGDQYYLDEERQILPYRSFFPAHVVVCNGVIPSVGYKSHDYNKNTLDSVLNNSIINDIYKMALVLDKDSFLHKQIAQMNVDINGEFTLVPLVSSHKILFGKAENIEAKFNKLKLFYTDGLAHHRWNDYKIINLKYRNQIVCTKI